MVERISTGEVWTAPRALDWNSIGEATENFQRHHRTRDGAQKKQWPIQTDWMWLRNDTSDRLAGDVLQAGDALLTDLDPFAPWFAGITPTHPVSQKTHGILRVACKSGVIERCQMSGIVRARVNIRDDDHKTCDAVDGYNQLQSFWAGPHKIVWKPSGTGVLDCWVAMYAAGEVFAEALLSEDLCPSDQPGTGTEGGDVVDVQSARLFPNLATFSPDPVTNPYNHRAPSGSRVKMNSWRVGLVETWEIIEVELRKLCVVNGIELSWASNGTSAADDGCIKYGSLVTGAEWCPSDFSGTACKLIDFGPCEDGPPACDLTWSLLVGSCCEGNDGPGS